MKLSQILAQINSDFTIISGEEYLSESTINSVEIDSRLVKKNSVFFALPGKSANGVDFIESALKKGASIIVSSEFPSEIEKKHSVIFIKTADPFAILVEFLQIFYSPLPENIYAITGTNGKTSTAEFTRQILEFLGKKSASIGTLGVVCDSISQDQLQISNLTTPDIVSFYKNLNILKENSVNDVTIEVSSIGLDQKRISGLKIEVGGFTNFTQDHLDYHGSMAEYFRCKTLLFSDILKEGHAVLNADIAEFEEVREICKNHKIIEYGVKARDLRLKKIEPIEFGQKVFFEFRGKNFEFNLSTVGDFQALNALCALGNVLAKHPLNDNDLQNLLNNFDKLQPAPGRMQRVGILKNKAQIFIDFAHSPDALENALMLARDLTKGRVLVMFGCGGNRDAAKRPLMAKIASSLADLIIITDDNPRKEDSAQIRSEIMSACDPIKTIEVAGRKDAIAKSIGLLEKNDILILAGKGHEKYQIIGEEKFEFNEEEIVAEIIGAAS